MPTVVNTSGVVRQVSDGDFTTAQINGSVPFSYPFISEGDSTSWEWRPVYRVDQASYVEPALLSKVVTPKGSGYIIDPGDTRDVGSGLVEYVPTIASLPVTRITGQTMTATFQDFRNVFLLQSFQAVTNAIVLKEYGLTQFQPYITPTVRLNQNVQYFAYGTWSSFDLTPPQRPGGGWTYSLRQMQSIQPWLPGSIVVGQDSTCTVYKGGMWYRETPLITYPEFNTL